MRKVIASEYVTLDGVMEAPEKWVRWNEEHDTYAHDQLFGSDALLLGRVTYQTFVAAWPSRTDDTGFAERMNSLPKFVASRTLKSVEWNARLLAGSAPEEVRKLKGGTGRDILIYGSADLVNTLMPHGLIDEYRLWIHPIVLGTGKRLFKSNSDLTTMRLADTKRFATGVVVLSYQPAEKTSKAEEPEAAGSLEAGRS